jgi:hypothetical protein
MARVKSLAVLWILGLVHVWLVLHALTLPLCWGADKDNSAVFSLAVNNEPLGEVLEKISKASGYQITVNEGWRNKTVSVRLENVTLEDGLKAVMEELGRPSHVLIYDKERKTIEIVLLTSSASDSESATQVESSGPFRRLRQIVPPPAQRAKPVARPGLRRMRARSPTPPVSREKTSDRTGPEEGGADLATEKKGPPNTETEVEEPPGEASDSAEREGMTPQTREETKAIPQTRPGPGESPGENPHPSGHE